MEAAVGPAASEASILPCCSTPCEGASLPSMVCVRIELLLGSFKREADIRRSVTWEEVYVRFA